MTTPQILAGARARLGRPGVWGALLLFAGLWNGLRWLTGPASCNHGERLLPFALGALVLGLAAAPWQWTGDDRPLAPLLRGLAQAVPWNLMLLLVLLPLLPEHGGRGGHGTPAQPFLPDLPPRLLAVLAASGAFALLAGWILADRDQEAHRAEAQAQLARAAQARALQAQMNPHVLVNTLGGLAELARENGAAAEEALVDLAGLLRRLLEHSGRAAASLGDERSLLEGFLALERFRLGDRLTVHWTWDEHLEETDVPPLLVQPLVENAVKHGIAPCREGGKLEIGLTGRPERLRLWVANTGMPFRPGTEGTGLANLRQRLALMDAWKGTLEVRSEGNRTLAELILEPNHA